MNDISQKANWNKRAEEEIQKAKDVIDKALDKWSTSTDEEKEETKKIMSMLVVLMNQVEERMEDKEVK